MPHTQVSLNSAPPAAGPPVLQEINQRWNSAGTELFDWGDRTALLAEIDLVNRAQTVLDEAAVKIAPSLLRIVLTVKENVPDPKEQRAFLAEHLRLDFRRVSELCIVADSYTLLDSRRRDGGAREIERYGWSIALKLAHVRDPNDRADLWRRACSGRPKAAYRDVLEEIHRYRERKLIAAPQPAEEALPDSIGSARATFSEFDSLVRSLRGPKDYAQAVAALERLQRELKRIRRSLREHIGKDGHGRMAESA
jgi:hypothetical protein